LHAPLSDGSLLFNLSPSTTTKKPPIREDREPRCRNQTKGPQKSAKKGTGNVQKELGTASKGSTQQQPRRQQTEKRRNPSNQNPGATRRRVQKNLRVETKDDGGRSAVTSEAAATRDDEHEQQPPNQGRGSKTKRRLVPCPTVVG